MDADSGAAVAAAVDKIAAECGPIVLIVVDTLARCFGPGDENATSDMSRFVAALDHLKARYGAAVLIVHHTGHAEKARSRGSMAMFGALDHEFRMEKEGEAVTVTSTKVKDSAPPPPLGFMLASIRIGTTAEGEAITSAALTATETPQAKPRGLTTTLQRALDNFDRARRSGPHSRDLGAAVHVDAWHPFFYETCTADTADGKRKAFQRVRSDLVARGRLIVEADTYRLAKFSGRDTECGTSGTNRDMSRSAPGHAGHVPKACPAVPPEMREEDERELSRFDAMDGLDSAEALG